MKYKHNFLFLVCISISTASYAATSSECPGEEGYYFTNYKARNPQKGGFISHSSDVNDDDDVFIAPTASVCGSASVRKNARIYGNAVIKGNAEITDNAKVYGNAVVGGDSTVKNDARIYENAKVEGSSIISGDAIIKGWSKIYDKNISTGVVDEPQFTAQELREQELKRQELLRKEQAKKERLEKNKALRDRLYSILENNFVIESKLANEDEFNKMVILNDPCKLRFYEQGFESSANDFDLHYRTYITTGVSTSVTDERRVLSEYKNLKFKNAFISNNLNTPYYYNDGGYTGYVLGVWTTEQPNISTSIPQVMISNSQIKHFAYIERVKENNGLSSDGKYTSFLFTNVGVRDDFYNTLDSLYKGCEAGP